MGNSQNHQQSSNTQLMANKQSVQPTEQPSFLEQKMNEMKRILYANKQPVFKQQLAKGFNPGKKPSQQNIIQIEFQDESLVQNRNQKIKDRFNDPRKLISDPLEYPYSAIGLLSFKTQGDSHPYRGTAFLVEKNLVLTCAHNLYNRNKKKRSIDLYFWPGRNGIKGECFKAKTFYYPQQYQTSVIGKEVEFDYGMVQLESSIGTTYGFLGLDFLGQIEGQAELAGYPLQIYQNGKQVLAEKKMYIDKGSLCRIPQSVGRMRYTMGTSGGQSGSPIFRRSKGECYAIGVHTDGGQSGENQGVVLDEEKRIKISKWIWFIKQQVCFNWMYLTDEEIRIFTDREKRILPKLKSLNLNCNNIGDSGANYLALGNLTNLTDLKLDHNKIGVRGAKALASGNLMDIRILYLSAVGTKHLTSGNLINLTQLYLTRNNIGDEGAKHLASGNLINMSTLYIDQNRIGPNGVKSLTLSNLHELIILNLSRNKIGDEGTKFLAEGNLTKITTLYLIINNISDEGAKYLSSGNLTNLTTLFLGSNSISSKGAKYLASGNLTNLTTLDLVFNNIDSKGVKHFAQGNLKNLIILNLWENKINSKYCQNEINMLKSKIKKCLF